jgi:hypothetical protein
MKLTTLILKPKTLSAACELALAIIVVLMIVLA